jgi:glycerophosphoryl diester phosphodiesterase
MPFDLQAHRGGMALTVENTLPAFATALELGVSTLEFDVQITADGHPVVAHDFDPSPDHLRDTEPVRPDDPLFPYVREEVYIPDLTLAQVRTIDAGSLRHPEFGSQRLAPGTPIPTLREVVELLERHNAGQVRMNLELKLDAARPERSAPREEYVAVVLRTLAELEVLDRTVIQSFDWESLLLVQSFEPDVPLYVLGSERYLTPTAQGGTPWLGGVRLEEFAGTLQERYVAAAAAIGATAVSPVHGAPYRSGVEDTDYVAFATAALVDAAHAADLLVVPYTVNDAPTLRHFIELGVDGIITDRPDVARDVMAEYDLPLPTPCPPATMPG